jgi:CubicO group peptidase (beta-lactamase class C family)
MKRIILIILSFLFTSAVLLTGCANKKTAPTETINSGEKEVQSKLEKYMKDYTTNNQFNGSILVAKNEKILFENGYGMADADNKIPNTPKTVFEIGSLTKQFTAAAVLMLQEKGLLNIQDTIDKYIENYPNGKKIKIYNLLNHTSGIPEYTKLVESMETGKRSYTPKELIEIFMNKPLNFETGTKFEYSNSNYILLGYIIEKVTGEKYEDYIKNNIFMPLKMEHTGMMNSNDIISGKAIGYSYISPKATAYEKAYEIEQSLPYAAGGIYSTVEDLFTWNNGLFTEKIINKNSLKEMLTPYKDNYGLGCYVLKLNGEDAIEHGGSISGYSSYIIRYINKGYTVIILSNKQEDANLLKIIEGISPIINSN